MPPPLHRSSVCSARRPDTRWPARSRRRNPSRRRPAPLAPSPASPPSICGSGSARRGRSCRRGGAASSSSWDQRRAGVARAVQQQQPGPSGGSGSAEPRAARRRRCGCASAGPGAGGSSARRHPRGRWTTRDLERMRHPWALRWRRRGGVRRRPRRGSWALGSGRSTTSRGRATGTGRGAGGHRRHSGARQRWGIRPGEGLPSVLPSFTRVAWQAIEVGWNCRRFRGLLLFCSCGEHALPQLKFWASSATGRRGDQVRVQERRMMMGEPTTG